MAIRRELPDPRLETASNNPHRRVQADPLDHRLECPLGRLFVKGRITEPEYNAGCRWRSIYLNWLSSIGAPSPFASAIDYNNTNSAQNPLQCPFDDDRAEAIAKAMRTGEQVLKQLGTRVFHAVNAVAVYEEPEEIGDFESTARAAKKGLAALAEVFG